MAYLMLKYKAPTTYALVDLSVDEFEIVMRALRESAAMYDRWGEDAKDHLTAVQALIDVLERRYEDD